MHYLLILLIGAVAGIVTGLIGASGVMVVVPALAVLGYGTADAIGASLFVDTIASLVVAWTYYQNKNLRLKQGVWIAIGSVVGAQIGSLLSPSIPEAGLSNAFSIFLVIVAVVFWVRGARNVLPTPSEGTATAGSTGDANSATLASTDLANTSLASTSASSSEVAPDQKVAVDSAATTTDAEGEAATGPSPKENAIVRLMRANVVVSGLILGLIVGIVSGLLGAGGGVMILLILVFLLQYSMHEGIGTSTLIMAFTAASGAIGHARSGNMPLEAAVIAAIGTLIGGRIAARFANRVNEKVLSKVVGGLFALLAIAMFLTRH